ncbi:MAG: porin family protein [Cyclobacteriaceae bacterium]
MKKLLFLVFTILLSAESYGQLYVGLKGGGNVSEATFRNNPDYRLKRAILRQGFQGGLVLRYVNQNNAGIQAEINYVQKGWNETVDTVVNVNTRYSRQVDYLEIPVLAHIYLGRKKFRIILDMGPYVGLALNATEFIRNEITQEEISNRYVFDRDRDNRIDYGLMAGGGFEKDFKFGTIYAEARYTFGFADFNRDKSEQLELSQNRTISISVGYLYTLRARKKSDPE